MTDTPNTFAVGDRVLVLGKFTGRVISEDDARPIPYVVRTERTGYLSEHHGSDLERIDEEATTDDAAVSGSMAGPSADLNGSPRTTAEPETAEPPVPTTEDLAAQVAHLTRRLYLMEGVQRIQGKVNERVGDALEALLPAQISVLDSTPVTTRRVHTKVAKNTKGYGFEISTEVQSDDPTVDVNALNWTLRDDADLETRRYIIDAEYRDQHGLPGDDEVTDF